MTGALVVSRVGTPAAVHGVHGAAGVTSWTCFSRRAGLDGDWEAIEWAAIPPGGVSGEHRHTRTEEVYFMLSGRAEIRLDGRRYPLASGGMVLTGLGSTHGVFNVGATPVQWLVIETLGPLAAAAVRGRDPAKGDAMADSGSAVVDLRAIGRFDPRRVFAGPLEDIRLRRLAAGESAEIVPAGREHTLFVTEGNGAAYHEETTVDLAPGTSITLPLGCALTVSAAPPGLEFFQATMVVPG